MHRATNAQWGSHFPGTTFAVPAIAMTVVVAVPAPAASAHDFNACTPTLTPPDAVDPAGVPHTITAHITVRGGNEYISPGEMCAGGGDGRHHKMQEMRQPASQGQVEGLQEARETREIQQALTAGTA
ncbi:MAG: hypothetical protein WAO61_06160 [Solirubrobacterales bacterium]